uniref:ankyrin repeat-containing protein At5g02620-like n=1 Tax=Erigeron canadensis TaxID=72917 RepID=UPI001CB9933F|nr:ankyrin repeat-containing protein At5g02620-like [Erigeron canadensis]
MNRIQQTRVEMMNFSASEITEEISSIEYLYDINIQHEYITRIPVPPPLPKSDQLPRSYNVPQRPPKYPRGDLLASREDYFNICVPLYEASIISNWEAANVVLERCPELVRFAINENWETPLHVVASAEETKQTIQFVKHLVKRMESGELEYQNKSGNTALCLACIAGNVKMVKIMVKSHPRLLDIPGSQRMMPLYLSALHGRYETVKYLYEKSCKMTGEHWTTQKQGWVLLKCVEYEFFDIALNIVEDCPTLVSNGNVFGALARKPDAFNGVLEQKLSTRIITSICRFLKAKSSAEEDSTGAHKLLRISLRNTIRKMSKQEVDVILKGPGLVRDGMVEYSSRILFVAAEMGNAIFLIELLRAYPDLIWSVNDDNYSIFHVATINRHQDVYNLLYEIGPMKDMLTSLEDKNGNNMLHLVGMTSRTMRSQKFGASLLMQRELSWFKEVEKMIPSTLRTRKNNAGETPYGLFFQNNQDLVSQGLNWTKNGMIVATLIITVAFAVAFTVPGGYNQEHGNPIFIHRHTFFVFVIADAVSLFSSSTSLLVFLSILTSRHSPRDFMFSLPTKLMIGQVTLFISVAAMMVTFSASFFVIYQHKLTWLPILIATLAAMPVIVFAVLQFPLWVDMFSSRFDSHNLFKPKKRMLYCTNPRF